MFPGITSSPVLTNPKTLSFRPVHLFSLEFRTHGAQSIIDGDEDGSEADEVSEYRLLSVVCRRSDLEAAAVQPNDHRIRVVRELKPREDLEFCSKIKK